MSGTAIFVAGMAVGSVLTLCALVTIAGFLCKYDDYDTDERRTDY